MSEVTSGGVSYSFDRNFLNIGGDYQSSMPGSFSDSIDTTMKGVDTGFGDVSSYYDAAIPPSNEIAQQMLFNADAAEQSGYDGFGEIPGQSGFLSNLINSLSAGGEKAEELWSSLDKDTKKAVLSVGGGLLNNVYQSNAAKELMDMKLGGEKELLQERARLEKESEDRKVRRSAHAPIGTQFADTGLLNATMMMGKK
jgi:hypothetical protein